jgi:hypothetical protein
MDANRKRKRPLITRSGMKSYTLFRATGATRAHVNYWEKLGIVSPAPGRESSEAEKVWPIEEAWVVHRMVRLTNAGMFPAAAGVLARKGPGVYDVADGVTIVLEDFDGDVD